MVDLLVGDAEDLEIHARAALREELADCRAESAGDHVLFDGHETWNPGGKREDPFLIERFREPSVDDCRLEPIAGEHLRRFHRGADGMAVREDRDTIALAKSLRQTDRDLRERCVESRADSGAARKPEAK